MTIGKRIKEERLAKKWTQEQLAVKLNVSRSTVSSWEVERNYPDLETIIAISDLFGQSLDQLLREDPEMITKKDRKVKNEKVYFRLLGLIGICFLIFIGNYVLKIAENSQELINAIVKLKPSSSKGTYLRGVSMASTMSPGIAIDTKSVQN